jgi:hypothetical protein
MLWLCAMAYPIIISVCLLWEMMPASLFLLLPLLCREHR